MSDDFDPKQSYIKLSASLEQPDKFAEIFCSAAKKQKSIDNVLKENIIELLQKDNEARNQIKSLLREIEKEDWRAFIKKGGSFILPLIYLVAGALLTGLSRKFFP